MSYGGLTSREIHSIRKGKDFIQRAKRKGFVDVLNFKCVERISTWIEKINVACIVYQLKNGKFRIEFTRMVK